MKHLAFSARTYTLGFNAVTALVAVNAAGDHTIRTNLIAITFSCAAWPLVNWLSDALQRDPGKPHLHPIAIILLGTFLAVLQPSPLSIGLFATYLLSIGLYSQKSRIRYMGPLGPILRGGTIFAQYMWLASLAREGWPPILALTAVIVTVVRRNYTGDIRDRDTDQWELPARVSESHALLVLGLLSLGVTALLGCQLGWLGVLAVGVCEGANQVYLWKKRHSLGPAAQRSHFAFVILDTFYVGVLAWSYGADPWLVAACGVLAVALAPTYAYVPGKDYGNLRKMLGRREEHTR